MSKKWVLIVDDDAMLRDMVAAAVEHPLLSVITAGDAAQAFMMARDLKPIVIVSDIQMPGLDGSSIYRSLRDDPSIPMVPIIFMTGMPLDKARLLFPASDKTIGLMQKPANLNLVRDYIWKVAGIIPVNIPKSKDAP